jgi:hypothetical protein
MTLRKRRGRKREIFSRDREVSRALGDGNERSIPSLSKTAGEAKVNNALKAKKRLTPALFNGLVNFADDAFTPVR